MLRLSALACLAATAASLSALRPAAVLRAPLNRVQRTSRLVAQNGWISGVDQASGQTYWYNQQTGQSQWEAPQGMGGQQGYVVPTQGYGVQAAWSISPGNGVYPTYTVRSGEQQVLGRYDMAQQSEYVSRSQCSIQVGPDGTATLISMGKPPTAVRSQYGAPWNYIQRDQRHVLQNGDQVSLDSNNPEGAFFTCQMEGSGQQGGYGQQQGGYQQQGYGQQQGGYGQQQGGYGQQQGGQQGGYAQQGGYGYGQQGGYGY